MSKKRITPFNEAHALHYSLEIASWSASTQLVDSVKCKFCIYFGEEGRKVPSSSSTTASARKRKVTENIKYFTRPFRVDNYKSHLKPHSEKWAEYQSLSNEQKKAFFEQELEKFVNTLTAHFEIERKECVFCLDTDIVEDVIGDMLFDVDDDDECSSKERALTIFKRSEDTAMYTVKIANTMKQF